MNDISQSRAATNGNSPDVNEHCLSAQHLQKTYGRRRVVDDASLYVREGEVVGLLGANGAGKTTTFYMMVGLETSEGGSIALNGEDVTGLPMYLRARLGLGYLPQEPSIFRKLTAEQNILAVLETRPMKRNERFERLEELLEEFGVEHVRKTRGDALSGGERRRVEIARCLATDPRYILLDEPFAGIDPLAIDDIRDIILYLKEQGIGILITDHNVRETLGITDRAYIMAEGRILKSGDPKTLVQDPDVRRLYLGERFAL
ncbi:MAG TPA: LPS export ABC transporter ATP-binding protein [Pyrinomonadaceae bacterium]|nr:LPS export ABC transporter ATP-binding protein [Pyrinomonadaceae bacterium]